MHQPEFFGPAPLTFLPSELPPLSSPFAQSKLSLLLRASISAFSFTPCLAKYTDGTAILHRTTSVQKPAKLPSIGPPACLLAPPPPSVVSRTRSVGSGISLSVPRSCSRSLPIPLGASLSSSWTVVGYLPPFRSVCLSTYFTGKTDPKAVALLLMCCCCREDGHRRTGQRTRDLTPLRWLVGLVG